MPIRSYLGQGPRIFRFAALLAVAGGVAARLAPEFFAMAPEFMQPLRPFLGWMFIIAGAVFLFDGVLRMQSAVREGRLETGGCFALVRHPIYTAWIVFLFPGIALVTGAWAVFLASFAAWNSFRKRAPLEEQAMLEKFGEPYREYRDRTPALFPIPK